MPRNNAPAASTLRNRNRITNKTRLKIHQGSLEADAVLIPDEDEEKHRLTNLVAGVDADDAREQHLQEVLSAASTSRLSNRVLQPPATAYIPTPDSTGTVANYDELYFPNRWKDPATYVCTSQTVEESIVDGIAGGFAYYMDERDKEWLDKNNEEARGEGTSAQGAASIGGTRASARTAKAKGKDPECSLPAVISEDEFELVMGVFEKVTHDRTEFLHHGLENGMDFPAFSEYQDVFSAPLPISIFATYSVPSWISPSVILKVAKSIYAYWKERRIERGGHCIIPTLNADDSDTANESYVCFRRRESKSVRKTRASQVTSSDKLARLQMEFHYPLELAKQILLRETVKKEVAQQAQVVWEKRLAFADVKRKFPTLNDKLDEELLVDKEQPVKKSPFGRVPGLKIKTNDAFGHRMEPVVRPKDRIALIREQVETTLERQKAVDHHWEDLVDNPYQPLLVPYASKLFKFVPPDAPTWPTSIPDKADDHSMPATPRRPRAVRMRYGRGGRVFLDRRDPAPRRLSSSSLFSLGEVDEVVPNEEAEEVDHKRRLEERWKFDNDDTPPVGPDGPDEHNRQVIDDYDTAFLRHAMTLHTESDHLHLVTDPTLVIFNSDGRPQGIVPYRLGVPPIIMRRDAQGVVRHMLPAQMQMLALQSGTPQKMQPSASVPQMRISSGGMRPPSMSATNSQSSPPQPLQSQSSQSHPTQSQSITPSPISNHSLPAPSPVPVSHSTSHGVSRPAISMPHVEVAKADVIATPANGTQDVVVTSTQPEANGDALTPARPKSQNFSVGIPLNGYHLPLTNVPAGLLNSPYLPQNGQHAAGSLSFQQVQNLRSAFANLSATEMAALNGGRPLPASYLMQIPSGANINVKVPNTRQTPWAMASQIQQQRSASVVNGVDGFANGMVSPTLSQSVPVRSPSANGQSTLRSGSHVNGQQSVSPSSPTLPNISQSPRTPSMGLPSTSLQQQPVGSNQNGY